MFAWLHVPGSASWWDTAGAGLCCMRCWVRDLRGQGGTALQTCETKQMCGETHTSRGRLEGWQEGKVWGKAMGMAAALSLSSLRHWRQGLTLLPGTAMDTEALREPTTWTDPNFGVWLKLPPWLCSRAGWMATSLPVVEDGSASPQLFDRNKSGLFSPAALTKYHTRGSVLYKFWTIWCYLLPEISGKRKHCPAPWESKSWIHREKSLTKTRLKHRGHEEFCEPAGPAAPAWGCSQGPLHQWSS